MRGNGPQETKQEHKKKPPLVLEDVDYKADNSAKSEKKLAALENEITALKSVIENFPGCIYWKNCNGVYLGRNSNAAARMHEVNLEPVMVKDAVVGKTDFDLFPEEAAKRYRQHDKQVLQTGREITAEEPITLPNGKIIIQLSTKAPLRDDKGNIIGVVGNAIDITYLKQIENKLKEAKNELLELKSEFISNMQHDIRTPLSGIYGLAFAIKKSANTTQIKEFAEHIEAASMELINFCNTILDFSSIAGGCYPVIAKKFNVRDLIANVISMNQPVAKQKDLKLLVTLPDKLHEIIIGDDFRVKRILMNLIGNALKFTQKGYVELQLEEIKADKRNIIMKFVIRDTGIGMPKDKQKIIFEKFAKLDPSNRGRYKGTGLGLSIVQEFICDIDGDIEVASDANTGTIIVCTVPFKLPLVNEMLK